MKLHKLFAQINYGWLALAAAWLVLSPVPVLAISQAQKEVLGEGINYFNTDTASSSIGAFCDSGSLPSTVPTPYNSIFTAAASKYSVPPAFLAALFYAGEHGSSWPDPPPPYGHGQAWADSHVTGGNQDWPTGTPGTRPIGARGPFQFEYPAWTEYGADGNGDGSTDVEDLTDAAFGGANYLAHLGANTTDTQKLHDAAYHYNGSGPQATAYADKVMAAFQTFSAGGVPNPSGASTSCSTTVGNVTINQSGAFGTGDGLMKHPPTMVGIHYTAGNEQTVQDVITALSDPTGSKHCNKTCSVQLTVLPDGSIYQLTSRLDVITENIINFNDADVGIEIAGANEQTLLANQKQFNAVVALVAQLMQQYNIHMQEDFLNKAGLMGHVECDDWSQTHIGTKFGGAYATDSPVEKTDSHSDPGSTYMSNLRSALQQAGIT